MNQPTLAELKAELEQLSKKIAELEKQPEMTAKERWEKEYGIKQAKLHLTDTWEILAETDKDAQLTGNQYDLMRELQIFAKLRNGDWVADWISDIEKFGISLIKGKAIFTYCDTNIFVYGISFKSKEIAQEALEIFGERIEKYYGK